MISPIISVILLVQTGQQLLPETIRALQTQTFTDFEVVCASCGTGEFRKDLPESDSRFTALELAHEDICAARKEALRSARGEYAIFLNPGDQFDPGLLEKLYAAVTENQADLAACNYSAVNAWGRAVPQQAVHTVWIPAGASVFSWRDCPDYILRVIDPILWNRLYRTEFLRNLDLELPGIVSDPEISLAAVSVAAAERISFVPEMLICTKMDNPVKDLGEIRDSVFAAVERVKCLPHREEIRHAITSFPINHFIAALSRQIRDFSSPEASWFYQMVHEVFNREEFAGISPRTLRNPLRYREFCTVKKHDYETMKRLVSRRLIVSMTSFPGRIVLIPKVLESLLNQRKKADEIILWLAREQFPGLEKDLPEELLRLVEEKKLNIRWCDDLKPHKKYFYALQEYTDDLVVTVDDDLVYSGDLLSSLYASYLLYPEAVSAVRVHLMMVSEEKQIMSYQTWIQETDECIYQPSMQLMATGGAGTLYPPNLFRKEFFDRDAIRENSLLADDLWLKAMQLVSDVPVVLARPFEPLKYLDGSQEEALRQINVTQNQNDVQLQKIQEWADSKFGSDTLIRKLTQANDCEMILGMEAVSRHLDGERKKLRRNLMTTQTTLRKTEESLKGTQENLRRTEVSLEQSQGKLAQTEEQLRRTLEQLKQTEENFRQTCNQLNQTEVTLRQTRDALNQTESKLNQTETRLGDAENRLANTETRLAKTEQDLRWTREHMPVGRQLRDLGDVLGEQKGKGNPAVWGCKYLIYLLAWIPEKLLAGAMYYLKNGFKASVRRVCGRSNNHE